jgi:hypothetical protein
VNRYTRIATQFWNDSPLNDNEKLLFLYILTSPHSNTIGFYVLPRLYIMHDLKWSRQRLAKPFNTLLRMGLVKYCDKTSVTLIPNFLKHNPIQNKNQAVAAAKALRKIPDTFLHDDFNKCIEQYAKPFIELFAKHLPKGVGDTDNVGLD